MKEELVAAVQAAVAGAIEPLKTEVADLRTQVAEVKAAQQAPPEPERKDANGRPFSFNVNKEAGVNNDSKPLWFSNVFRGVMAGGQGNPAAMKSYAAAEMAMSERLKAMGYAPESLGGMLMCLDENLICDRVGADGTMIEGSSTLKAELRGMLGLGQVDPGELGWLARRNPEILRNFGISLKDMKVGDDVLGGYLIPTTQGDRVIDLLRARLTVMAAGATEFPLPASGNLTLPRLNADPDFAWTDADMTSDQTATNAGLGVVRLSAKGARGWVTIPNDLLRYSSPSIELLIRAALASKFARVEDRAYLEGVANGISPKGLVNYPTSAAETPAVGKLTLHVASTTGNDGNTFQPEDIELMKALYWEGNNDVPPTAWILRPGLMATILNKRADAVSANDGKGPFLFQTTRGMLAEGQAERISGVQAIPSTAASKNRVKGNGTTLQYIVLGNFANLYIGRSGVLELAVSEHVRFFQDKTVIRAVGRVDSGLAHEESFVLTDTLL